ncbi:phycobilisome protein [Alkalinema pantanalense CENA528]|uniref:phycobilisome protein n=1 Tax=Alkalinema pantanalense TaxID=1620705 RepID=UPI003D6F91FF
MAEPLSPIVQELILKAKIMNFQAWFPAHPADSIALFQAADDNHHWLSDEELEAIATAAPKKAQYIPAAKQLRDNAADIVDQARASILQKFPGITEPGGGLYPEMRAEACWRDFQHFLRSISYAIAGNIPDYLSQQGLHFMEALYLELAVPLDAMTAGIDALAEASQPYLDPNDYNKIKPFFQHLSNYLSHFGQD